jgi:hypothetical protein
MRAEGGQSSTARMRGGWRVEGVPGSNVRSELTAQAGGLALALAQQASPLACSARLPLLHFPPRSLAPSWPRPAARQQA